MISAVNYDGDKEKSEGIYGEVETMLQALLDAIVVYSVENSSTNEVIYRNNYPYWFAAKDGEELIWTPTLLRAAYNYQYVLKDPGGFAHNFDYVIQLLYDSIEAVGGDVSTFVRP